MMPKMDGMEATREIRKWENEEFKRKHGAESPQETPVLPARLPIIALTANAVAGMKEMFLANGFDGFISKPIVIKELDTILKEWLSPEKVRQNSESETTETDDAYNHFIENIRKIDEINTDIGIRRFSGMKDILYNTLKMFYKNIPSECRNMTSFLETKDLNSFIISVHTMKSSLATIGVMRLSETAFELETASKNGDYDYCMEQFPELKEKLLALHEKLSVVFPNEEILKKESGDKKRLLEDAQKIIAAAEDYDNDTGIEIIKNLLPCDFGKENNTLLENALDALENFEYEGAVEILRKLG